MSARTTATRLNETGMGLPLTLWSSARAVDSATLLTLARLQGACLLARKQGDFNPGACGVPVTLIELLGLDDQGKASSFPLPS